MTPAIRRATSETRNPQNKKQKNNILKKQFLRTTLRTTAVKKSNYENKNKKILVSVYAD